MADAQYPFLNSTHAVWDIWNEFWLRQEHRLFGGEAVRGELDRFSSEAESVKGGAARYASRQRQATYLNFPDVAATAFVGQLSRQAPQPDEGLNYGALGEVRSRDQLGAGLLTRAEMAFYNIDGVGNDGSQWTPWWDAVTKRAKATGHRWCMAEAPKTAPISYEQELLGLRPFMVEYSPYQVRNWHYINGQLAFAIIKIPLRDPKLDGDGALIGNDFLEGTYLLVQQGFTGFGSKFAGGGWWLFDHEQGIVDENPWINTFGRIPLWVHYYEQTKGPADMPAMSRSGLAEVSNLAVSYMNQSSARDFDAWDAAKSLLFAMGISQEGWDLLSDLMSKGSEILPVLGEQNLVTGGSAPVTMFDGSTGAVAAEVFDKLLHQKISEAREIASYEARVAPTASGISQQTQFTELKSPRLSLMASNREQSENTALYFLSQRWGIAAPDATVIWPRDFDINPLEDDIDKMFATMKLSGVKSKTLTTEMIIMAAKKRGLITEQGFEDSVRAEIGQGMDQAAKEAAAITELGGGPGPVNG
jgi:hypothetical protein